MTRRFDLALVAPFLLIVIAVLVRFPSWSQSSIDWDETMFALAGRELLHGHLPYTTMFDNKPPGVALLLAGAMAIAGETVLSMRLLGTACAAATAILLYYIVLSATSRRSPAFGAGLLYLAFSTGLNGLGTLTEIMLEPFTTAGILVAVTSLSKTRPASQTLAVAGMGFLFGLAIFIKSVAALPAAAAFPLLVLFWSVQGQMTVIRAIAFAALYTVACALPMVLSAALYWREGLFGAFWYANFGFMGVYVSVHPSFGGAVRYIEKAAVEFWQILLCGVAAIAAISAIRKISDRSAVVTVGIAVWFLAEFASACAPGQFFSHYFLLVLPSLSALSAILFWLLAEKFVASNARSLATVLVSGFIALDPIVPYFYKVPWMNLDAPDIPRQIAAIIKADIKPGETAYVVNYQPVIYLLAHIPLPTPVPFPDHLVGGEQRLIPIDPARELARVLGSNPRFIVIDRSRWPLVTQAAGAAITTALATGYELRHTYMDASSPIELYQRKP